MPGCYFRVAGAEFDPEAFLASASLTAYSVWHVGEPLAKAGPRASQFHESSGFACDVSTVDGDLDGQIDDAIAFLTMHRESLVALASDSAVEDQRLDFGIDCRLGSPGVAVQGEWLPVQFLHMVGELRIGVALSIYPPARDES